MSKFKSFLYLICISLLISPALSFQSDELLVDDEEFGLEGGRSPEIELLTADLPSSPSPPPPPSQTTAATGRKRSVDADLGSRVQFSLEHAFGDSAFSPAGVFTARLKTSPHGGQTLTKLRFSRNDLTATEKESFKKLLEDDDFYRIKLPSDVLSPPGRDYVISSVKARCLPRDGLDEQFFIHTEGVNILAVNYGSPGACQYMRQVRLPAKWSFNSRTVLKSSELAPRTPTFSEDIGSNEIGEDEGVKPLEKSFWAKYWMYLIPLGLIVMNAMTQAMNMAEEQGSGQSATQTQQPAGGIPRGQSAAVRRR